MKKKDFWNEKIPYLKKMKNFYSKMNYEGINLWPVMAGDVYTYYYFSHINLGENLSLKEKILTGIKSLFFKDKFPLKNPEGKILISYFMPRKDHHKLVKKAVSGFREEDLIWMDAFRYKQKNILLRGRISFPDILLLLHIWKRFKKNDLKSILKNYYWFYILKTHFRIKQIKILKRIFNGINPKVYVSFCSSAFAEEAILTLISKNKNIPTFTLQHGFLSKPKDPFTSVSIQNENAVSDYMLVWGKESCKTMKKYSSGAKPILAGNPKYELIKTKKNNKFNPRKATIFFSVPANNKGNFKLLRIVKKFIENHPKISFNVTVHPMNNVTLFSKHLNYKNVGICDENISVKELLEKSDFVILYNTSVSLEALNYKIPIFQYEGKNFMGFWEKGLDTFKNSKELENIFNKVKKKNFQSLIKFYEKESKKTFYFHEKKTVPQIYYEKIKEIVGKKAQ